MLPALNSGGIHANQLGTGGRRNRSFLTNQNSFENDLQQVDNISPSLGIKKMVEWFSNWLPWQKKILLCGITERCSKSQLDLLVSTLEPVFHRDFVAALSRRYPSAGIRRMYERREARRAAALVYHSEDSIRDSNVTFNMDDGGGLSDAFRQSLSPDEEEFVDRLTRDIFDEAFKTIRERETEPAKRDILTPHERADIDALSPSRVFGGLTPQLSMSPDVTARRTITSGAFRPSVERVSHQHLDGVPGRISTVDFRTDEVQSSRSAETDRQSLRLRKKFNWQLGNIWKWLATWPEQEKVRVLAELVELSDKTEIHYLSQCILLRLKAHGDINSLPDKLLYQIFCMLPTSDLLSASQVCRRWHYIASRDELWMYKSFELGQKLGVPNVVSLVKRKFHRHADNIDWRFAYHELSAIGHQAKQSIPLPKRADSPVKSEALTQPKKSSRRYSTRRTGSRAMSITSTGSRNSIFYTAYRHQVSRKSHSRSGRSSRASSSLSEQDDFVDRRPLMKPILGKLKRFQDSEDVALDVRPQLKQMNDVLEHDIPELVIYGTEIIEHLGQGMSEAKEVLCWKHDLERTGQRGTFITEVQPIQQCRRLQGHLDSILCLQFDERRLITGSMDRSIRIWDVRSGRSIRKLYGHKGGIGCLHFVGNSLVSGSWDMTVMLWSLEPTFERRATLSGHVNTVTAVKIVDRYIISASLDGTVRVYSNISLFLDKVLNLQEPIQCIHCDGSQLFTGHTDRIIRIARFPSGEPIISLRGHSDQILTIVVSGRLLISGGQLGYVRFWDWRNGACEAGVNTQPKSAVDRVAVNSLTYYRGHFWSGHADGSIREWNLATMTCVRTLVGHKGPVRGLQVSMRRVVTASDDGSSRIWEFPRPRRTDAPEIDQQQTQFNRKGLAPQGELIKARVLLQPSTTPSH